jgi:hypothetical protein
VRIKNPALRRNDLHQVLFNLDRIIVLGEFHRAKSDAREYRPQRRRPSLNQVPSTTFASCATEGVRMASILVGTCPPTRDNLLAAPTTDFDCLKIRLNARPALAVPAKRSAGARWDLREQTGVTRFTFTSVTAPKESWPPVIPACDGATASRLRIQLIESKDRLTRRSDRVYLSTADPCLSSAADETLPAPLPVTLVAGFWKTIPLPVAPLREPRLACPRATDRVPSCRPDFAGCRGLTPRAIALSST